MEQEKIIEAFSSIFKGADAHDWRKVLQAMAENVWFDYASLSGNPAAMLPSKQIIESWEAFLPGFDRTHHQLFNFVILQNADKANLHAGGRAEHFIGDETWAVEGSYDA